MEPSGSELPISGRVSRAVKTGHLGHEQCSGGLPVWFAAVFDASEIRLPVSRRVACGQAGQLGREPRSGVDHGLFAANIAANNP